MKFTLRSRLTAWYATLLAVSLIIFGTVLYYSLFKVFTDNIDDQIDSVSGMMVHAVIGPAGRLILPRHFDIILERFFGIKTSGNYIQVLGANGKVEGKSSSLEGFILPLTEYSYQNALRGDSTYEVVDTIGRFPVRVITKPVIAEGGRLVAVIQVGSSLEGIEKIFRYIVYVFLFGGLLAVVVASAVGWFLARKALEPVVAITAMTRKIGAENLHERLVISGPFDEIGDLAETFNDMIERLEESFDQVRQFTADASHELKTPLTVMRGEVEVALMTDTSAEDMRAVLVSSLEEVKRMNNIVTNLLDLAKADVASHSLPKEHVRLDTLVLEAYEFFSKIAYAKGIKLDIIQNDQVTVLGDGLRLTQLLRNLIDNAIKYIVVDSGGVEDKLPQGAEVTISLSTDGDKACLRIKDTGIGIPSDELAHIFNRFYRVDKVRSSSADGTGLGLNICKVIVDSMDGEINAVSELGLGTEFIVTLPSIDNGLEPEHATKV